MKHIVTLLALIVINNELFAQQGLDSSFGTNGVSGIPYNYSPTLVVSDAYTIAVQQDGKIVTAGLGNVYSGASSKSVFVITRHKINGALDSSFDNDGIALIDPTENGVNKEAFPLAVIIDNSNRIVVGGINRQFENGVLIHYSCIVRLNANGTPDNTFSGNGVANIRMNPSISFEELHGLAIQTDNKIVFTGMTSNTSMNIGRLTVDGKLDSSFNGNGKIIINNEDQFIYGLRIAIQPDGKIVALGAVNYVNRDFLVVRVNSNGSFDNSFNNDGKVVVDMIGTIDSPSDIAVLPDGKIVVLGTTDDYNAGKLDRDISVVCLNANGSLNTLFDGDGKKTIDFTPSDISAAIAVQSNGKIIIGGYTNPTLTRGYLSLMKLKTDGSFDSTFYGDGSFEVSLGDGEFASDIALQPDGKKIIALDFGMLANGVNGRRLVRVWNDEKNSDNEKPKITYCPSFPQLVCYVPTKLYNIPLLQASDNSGVYTVSFYVDGATSNGNAQSPVAGNNATGTFNSGSSVIHWRVKDEAGNEDTCSTVVTIGSPINIAIPDVLVIPKGVVANTVYIGYAPAAILAMKAIATTITPNAQPFSYKWSTSGGLFIKHGTANLQTVQVMGGGIGNDSGSLKVVVTDNNGCSSEKTITIKVIDVRCGDKVLVCKNSSHTICVAESAVAAELNNAGDMLGGCSGYNTIVIAPNPTSSYFTLHWQNDLPARLTIRDVLGRVIEVKNLMNGAVKFGASYPPGFYFAEITRENETVTLKLVKL